MEGLHTHTLFYKAQLFRIQKKSQLVIFLEFSQNFLIFFLKSALYCQKTLERQLAMNSYEPVVYDTLEIPPTEIKYRNGV